MNKDKKVSFIRVEKYGALARASEFMRTCHNMNIIVQTTGENEYELNGISEIPKKTLSNITRALILKSIQNTEIWCLYYKYDIWIYL